MADLVDATPFRRSAPIFRGSPAQDEDRAFKPSDKNRLLKVEKGEVPRVQLTIADEKKIEGTVRSHLSRHEAELSSLKNTDTEIRHAIEGLKNALNESEDSLTKRADDLQGKITKVEQVYDAISAHVFRLITSKEDLLQKSVVLEAHMNRDQRSLRDIGERLSDVESRIGELTEEDLASKTTIGETKKQLSDVQDALRATQAETELLQQMTVVLAGTTKDAFGKIGMDIEKMTSAMETQHEDTRTSKKHFDEHGNEMVLITEAPEEDRENKTALTDQVSQIRESFGKFSLGLAPLEMSKLPSQVGTLQGSASASASISPYESSEEPDTPDGVGPLLRPSDVSTQSHQENARIGALERSLSLYIKLWERHGGAEDVAASWISPAIFPNGYVKWLRRLDLRLPSGMARFRDVDVRVDKHMLLSEGSCCYYLQQVNNIISYKEPVCLARDRRGLADDDHYVALDRPVNERAYKDVVMELTARPTADTQSVADTGDTRICPPPRYVVSLGEVFYESEDPHLGPQSGRTGYYLVMDVTTPARSLWIVFGYEYRGLDGSIKTAAMLSQKDNKFCVFAERPGFDIAKIADDVKDWDKQSGVRLYDQPELHPDAVRRCIACSARTAGLVFTSPKLSSLLDDINRGWEGYSGPSPTPNVASP